MVKFIYGKSIKKFLYSYIDNTSKKNTSDNNPNNDQLNFELEDSVSNELLKMIGRESLKENLISLNELEQKLGDLLTHLEGDKNNLPINKNLNNKKDLTNFDKSVSSTKEESDKGNNLEFPILRKLIQKGYLKDTKKWLTHKGFIHIGEKILQETLQSLMNKSTSGLHETKTFGHGSIILDSSKKYEIWEDFKNINVNQTILNSVYRLAKTDKNIKIPFEIDVADFEQYETFHDTRVGVVYCIDLSSTMRYSSLYTDLSRIEAAKKALWNLFILNRKFFPNDSIYVIGFGALASKVNPYDIPYLKTFEPGSDFLHYTNYQAALRISRRLLLKDLSTNRRVVLITDGHPSACFIDNKIEYDTIISEKPYSNFYSPNSQELEKANGKSDLHLDLKSGEIVYLCYRYKQVDPYVAKKTLLEAKTCKKSNINIDTIMISEDDSLWGYVTDFEKQVSGKAYYINPSDIDKVLIQDYLSAKKNLI